MKSEEAIKKELIQLLKKQAERLEKGDLQSILSYKHDRQRIFVLEDVLELNVINQ